ncbi:MAG: hypothetical protein J6O50_02520 [Ruminiclostridium sp.]|nr:hypothetical protein [Ruminiclostridium sp.]
MFLLDFSVDQLMNMLLDWIYQQIVKVIGDFFGTINQMGVDLFSQPWIQQIVALFSKLGWALFAVGFVVAIFEFAIEYQNGRGDPKALALNTLKGFFAVSLFTVLPVRLYALSLSMQIGMNSDMTGYIQVDAVKSYVDIALDVISVKLFGPLLAIIIIVMMAYAVVKVFLASLKRGGILLIQMAIGSLYMFSVPRGYTDGLIMWMKQVIALCLTSFLQSTMLIAGLILFKDTWLLGLGIMLAAGEIPRIAGNFGLETAARPNVNMVINTAQSAVHLVKMVAK